jgi:hypothetical protein
MTTRPDVPAVCLDPNAWKLFVFRKHRERLSTKGLLADLKAEIHSVSRGTGSVIDALVRAGELETGLEEENSRSAALMAEVVDELAAAALGENCLSAHLLQTIERAEIPIQVRCSHPEGFSYYGLNPLDFADLAGRLHPNLASRVRVIGIRTVGSTLGACVAAALRARGTVAWRITVRPEGEPYQRTTTFTPAQMAWIRAGLEEQADFVVVDEGPGFSGSTFLSVANALIQAGAALSRVVLMGSRPFPVNTATAEQARQSGIPGAPGVGAQGWEWGRFRSHTIEYAKHRPLASGRILDGGAWRELLYHHRAKWPASWIEQERIKHLSTDGRNWLKFEGFGRFGRRVRDQAGLLAEAGLAPRLFGFDSGFGRYEFVQGRPLTARDLSRELISRLAGYCAFRASNFSAENSDLAMLGEMLRVNLEAEFGLACPAAALPLELPVYADCRMLPHEWLTTTEGRTVKSDGAGHGEGHQLPGPVDIAWDLAGVIVEWGLETEGAEFFLAEYRRQSGDDPRKRMPAYLLAYSVHRIAHCRMAAASTSSPREHKRLRRAYESLRRKVKVLLEDPKAVPFRLEPVFMMVQG